VGHNNQEISPLQDVRNYDMELFADYLVRCVLDWVTLYLPPKAELFLALRAGGSPARAPHSGAEGGAGGGTPPPQRFLRSC
jgi:hypothetical protein